MTGPNRKAVNDALHELGVITDLLQALAGFNINNDHAICGSLIEWLAQKAADQQNRIEEALIREQGAAA